MYSVVEFQQTKEVELVPTVWVKDGYCYWPSSLKGMALYQAIRNAVEPDHSWDLWEVRSMFTTQSYEEGRRKAKEAEMTSDLQSEAEASDQRPIRRKKKSVRLEEDSEEEEPSPSSKRLAPVPPILPPSVPASSQALSYTELTGPIPSPNNFNMFHTWQPGTEVQPSPGYQTFRWAPQQSEPELQMHCNTGDMQSILKELLTKMEMVLDQQNAILRLLQHRETQLGPVEHFKELPLQDLDQLMAMEQRLGNSGFKEKLVSTDLIFAEGRKGCSHTVLFDPDWVNCLET
ncbi:uncharacterized protein LOC113127583 [Mastacembelus armatus]|uniref:uncharacterized protein LOC113127583 n=1 Tax=Mastacembelus armatus TaxID=205130 RepID=UPI000E454B0C|nr:uncharacterized protein LOC113127583 [Mastacembelus armatus]